MTVTAAVAQESETKERQRVQRRSADAGKLDEKTRGANIRVSQLMGYNIQNSQGESVGEIKDIVIDSRTGKVKYAAVTYGGFIGLGNKLFAVPFEAFKVQVDPDEIGDDDIDADDYVLVLNVTQQQLEGQEGFDEDNWPDMADSQWARELDKRYGVNRNEDAKERMKRLNRESNNE
ncbi:PRC-barrel domain-containing protein [Stieleria sp.]|uniref:PRC-barrel domain-containing protein n=1 Tax=Stieleria sp. TaxID=2795976 RepID=UPI0035649260